MGTKIFTNNFILYGLNRFRNFVKYANDEYIALYDEQEVKDFCTALLHENPCPDSAMFCVFNDGMMLAVIKIWDEGEKGKYEYMAARDMHFFSRLDAELRLCCYGLMCEITPGQWRIQK
jgi:hypothetical protein